MTKFRSIHFRVILALCVLLFSCNSAEQNKPWSALPEVTELSGLKETEFVPTLENPISEKKNCIYAPALLFAWDAVEKKLGTGIRLSDSNSDDLKLLFASKSHERALSKGEYSIETQVENDVIRVRAFFNKTLPFAEKLQSMTEPVFFNGKSRVAAFGLNFPDREEAAAADILYYRDDSEFIVRLNPKDPDHEIILFITAEKFQSLFGAVTRLQTLVDTGNSQRKISTLAWKYEFTSKDVLSIPVIRFNIATKFRSLEGQTIQMDDGGRFLIEEAVQRTGFILNEEGAVVESEAEFTTAALDIDEPIEKPRPKEMIFDRSFVIVVKRRNEPNPYFVMTVNNAELLNKVK